MKVFKDQCIFWCVFTFISLNSTYLLNITTDWWCSLLKKAFTDSGIKWSLASFTCLKAFRSYLQVIANACVNVYTVFLKVISSFKMLFSGLALTRSNKKPRIKTLPDISYLTWSVLERRLKLPSGSKFKINVIGQFFGDRYVIETAKVIPPPAPALPCRLPDLLRLA